MHNYRNRDKPPGTAPPSLLNVPAGVVPAYDNIAEQYGVEEDPDDVDMSPLEQSVDDEYAAYMTAPRSPKGTDLIRFWQLSASTFPTFFSIALDYLPIQASSVPSERVFSSSAETDTAKRNRIPALMEALQMLKFGTFIFIIIILHY